MTDPTQALARTQFARVRTVAAMLVTAAIVGRFALETRPPVAAVSVVVALVVLVVARRSEAAPSAGRAVAVAGCVLLLAAAGLVTVL